MAVTQTRNIWPREQSKPGTSLQAVGLVVNSHKTAFIVTDKTIHKELAKLLRPNDPPIQTVMRDLGIDHSAGRRRRIATLQQRFRKNRQRRIKLRSLKLPNLRTMESNQWLSGASKAKD